jgi:hypothetical protein
MQHHFVENKFGEHGTYECLTFWYAGTIWRLLEMECTHHVN